MSVVGLRAAETSSETAAAALARIERGLELVRAFLEHLAPRLVALERAMPRPPELLTAGQALEWYGVPRGALYYHLAGAQVRVGRRVCWRREQVEALVGRTGRATC